MMNRPPASLVLLATLGLSTLVAGCAGNGSRPEQAPPPPPTLTPDQAEAQLQEGIPGTQVGILIEINTEAKSAAIEGLPTEGLRQGDPITLVNPQLRPVAYGRIFGVQGENVYIDYDETLLPGGRAPNSGDYAVLFPETGASE